MIGLVGINHRSAHVEIRERLVFSEEEISDFGQALHSNEKGAEIVVISTCNRTEVYFNLNRDLEQNDLDSVRTMICEAKSSDAGELSEYFYSFVAEEAVRHLFRVAAGLDSMVLGENQILGQVRDAYEVTASRKLTSTVLNRLFHASFSVGKRVRTETVINEGASSVSYAAVELASSIFDHRDERAVALVGAGETGELVLEGLVRRGYSHIQVANRTVERARSLAGKYGSETEIAEFEELESVLLDSDIVIASTSSAEPIIDRRRLVDVVEKRQGRPLFLIDLAVPRDIDEDVKSLEQVFLYDIDDLEDVVARTRELRSDEMAKAEVIVGAEADQFFLWLRSLSLSPTIRGLKQTIAAIGADELEKLAARMPQKEFQQTKEYADYLRDKLLSVVVKRLRTLTNDGQGLEYIDLVNRLFDLSARQEE